MTKPGKVYLVGAGPGDPGLITVKGQALLRRAEVIIYDDLANPVLLELTPPQAERIYVGHEDPAKKLSSLDWEKLATAVDTLVFYMGMANLENICEQLITHGRSPETPVVVVRWATLPRQETLSGNLASIAGKVRAADFKPPAVILVGEVNNLRDELRWFDNRPLSGRRVLVTRAAEQATLLTTALEELGAEALGVPTIEIIPPSSFAELDQAITELPSIDYLLLTSSNAVNAFFGRLTAQGLDARALAGLQTVVVGPKSADALAARGVNADLMPANYRAEGMVALLKDQVFGKRLLYPKAALARDLIPTDLTAAGAEVIAPVAYASAPPADAAEKLQQALAGRLDLLTFTASSTVQNFVDLLDAEELARARQIPVASIGPLTSETARTLGFNVVIEPEKSTLNDMIEAINKYFTKANGRIKP